MRICNKFKFISRLINGFYLWLRRYSLSTRFFIVCISLCIVPLILATGIVFFTSYSRETDNYISFTQQNMVQTSNNLFNRLMNVRTDAIDFAYNSYIQDFTEAYGSENSSVGRVPVTEELVHSVVGRFNSTSDSAGLIILSPDGSRVTSITIRIGSICISMRKARPVSWKMSIIAATAIGITQRQKIII